VKDDCSFYFIIFNIEQIIRSGLLFIISHLVILLNNKIQNTTHFHRMMIISMLKTYIYVLIILHQLAEGQGKYRCFLLADVMFGIQEKKYYFVKRLTVNSICDR
jgi:hypothetical protein